MSRAALARNATTGARCCGDRRGLCRLARLGCGQGERGRARRDLLLPLVFESIEGRALGALVRRSRRDADAVDAVLPEPWAVLVVEREARRSADARDRRGRNRDPRRLLVGFRLTRERASVARRAGSREAGAGPRHPHRAVPGTDTCTCGRRHRPAPRGARYHRLLRLRR